MTIKRNEVLTMPQVDEPQKHHAESKKNQTSKVTQCMIPLFKMSGTGKSIETESRLVVHCNVNLKMPF